MAQTYTRWDKITDSKGNEWVYTGRGTEWKNLKTKQVYKGGKPSGTYTKAADWRSDAAEKTPYDKAVASLGKAGEEGTAWQTIYDNIVGPAQQITDTHHEDVANLINQSNTEFANSGQTDAQTQQTTDYLIGLMQNAGNVDPDRAAALAEAKARMGGYSEAERNLAMSAGKEELSRALATAQRGAAVSGASRGITGGAQGIPLNSANRDYTQGMGDLVRDVFLSEIGRKDEMLKLYGDMGASIDQDKWNNMNTAGKNAYTATSTNQEANRQNRLAAWDRMSGLRTGAQVWDANLQAANIDLLNTHNVARMGAFTGGVGRYDTNYWNEKGYKLGQQGIEAQQAAAEAAAGATVEAANIMANAGRGESETTTPTGNGLSINPYTQVTGHSGQTTLQPGQTTAL